MGTVTKDTRQGYLLSEETLQKICGHIDDTSLHPVVGPQGPIGPVGPAGPQGDAGPVADQEICTGDFVDVSGRDGWIFPRTELFTTTQATVIEDWVQISTAETSPDCVTDITINGSVGESYFRLRNMWGRAFFDVRFLIDGVALGTWALNSYHYSDKRLNDVLKQEIGYSPSFSWARASVPANSTITVEALRRYAFTAGSAALGVVQGDHIAGLRSHFNVHYSPAQIVTGRQ